MKHFEELLQTLGGESPKLLEETENWAFWTVIFPTPASNVRASYLSLKSKCPLKEATEIRLSEWARLTGSIPYEVVVTPHSPLSKDLNNTNRAFRGSKSRTSHGLLFDNLLAALSFRSTPEEEFFIEPSLVVDRVPEPKAAMRFLVQWLLEDSSNNVQSNIGVLKAHGGIGKTTLCRVLCNRIQRRNPTVMPILIESSQWQANLSSNLQMRDIWDIAISRSFLTPSRLLSNDMALRVLIREGIFIPILDGFDELCLSPSSKHGPDEIVQQLLDMLDTEDGVSNARILLTTRDTFWNTLDLSEQASQMKVFSLLGFSNSQKQEYFNKRLVDPLERDTASRLASEISGKIYDSIQIEGVNAERPEGVPFILDMIASYVHENPNPATINPYHGDPLAPLLEAMCRRENVRQNLEIPFDTQLSLFEELFREFPENFTSQSLNEYLQVICDVQDPSVWNRFKSHVFLKRITDDVFESKYEVLRVYFVARFLARGLVEDTTAAGRKIAKIFAQNSSGSTEVIDWLASQLKTHAPIKLRNAVRHAKEIISQPENQREFKEAGSALYRLLDRVVGGDDKESRCSQMLGFVGDEVSRIFQNIVISGSVRSLDLRNIRFVECTFNNVEFRNCSFDDSTSVKRGKFLGILKWINCSGEAHIVFEDCKLSGHAEIAIGTIQNKETSLETKQIFCEEALAVALKKFKGQFGFGPVQYRRRMAGLPSSNPYSSKIWESLVKVGIVERHHISNVAEGGLNIADNQEVRRDVRIFLDNGFIGHTLRKAMDNLIVSF